MRLITIPFSHYSEKSRWALDHLGISYTETSYLPMAHLAATLPLGGRSVPLLVDGSTVRTDSTDILLHLDALHPGKLLSEDPAERAAALDAEEYCDRQIGVASRAWVYSETLSSPVNLGLSLGRGRPPLQRALLPLLMTFAGPMIARSYRVQPGQPERWLERLRAAFDEIGRRLERGGGRYLVGDRFTAADLTFAALAAPALMPPEHPVMRPPSERTSDRMRRTIDELRATPAGRHALRMYREHRASGR